MVEEKRDRRWYVINTYSGYEKKVQKNLEQRIETMGIEDRIFRVLVPEEQRMALKDGKKKITKRKVFPGYVLVEMILDDQSWYVVRHTPGVTGFVGTGTQPIPLSDPEVKAIMRQIGGEEQKKHHAVVNVHPGDMIKVKFGPFEGTTTSIVDVLADKGKALIMVQVFGRDTKVEIDLTDIDKI